MQTIEKPWGKEELIEHNERYVLKKLTMKAGHRCSLQYHEHKMETIYVLKGALKVYIGPTASEIEEKVYVAGESFTIEPITVHRMEGVTDAVYLEASTSELDDVVRLEDDYSRV